MSSGGSSFITRPLTGVRPMTGVSIPISRGESDTMSRPLTGTEDMSIEANNIQHSSIVKVPNNQATTLRSPYVNEPGKVIKKRVRTPNPALKFHERGKYKS